MKILSSLTDAKNALAYKLLNTDAFDYFFLEASQKARDLDRLLNQLPILVAHLLAVKFDVIDKRDINHYKKEINVFLLNLLITVPDKIKYNELYSKMLERALSRKTITIVNRYFELREYRGVEFSSEVKDYLTVTIETIAKALLSGERLDANHLL